MKPALSILAVVGALSFSACDVKVDNPPSGDTTVVNPPAEKNTTIVNPPAEKKTEKTETTTTAAPGASVTTEKKTETN